MLSAWPELRPHPDVLQVTSGPWAALRVRQSRDEMFAPRVLGKKEVKRGFLLLKETQRFGGKSIYLTDLARRALSWWLASVQAPCLTGTGRII